MELMDVKILATGQTETVNASFGARLIEQGQAIACPAKSAHKPEKASGKRTRKDVKTDGPDGQDQG